jgi:hypothetical protein
MSQADTVYFATQSSGPAFIDSDVERTSKGSCTLPQMTHTFHTYILLYLLASGVAEIGDIIFLLSEVNLQISVESFKHNVTNSATPATLNGQNEGLWGLFHPLGFNFNSF